MKAARFESYSPCRCFLAHSNLLVHCKCYSLHRALCLVPSWAVLGVSEQLFKPRCLCLMRDGNAIQCYIFHCELCLHFKSASYFIVKCLHCACILHTLLALCLHTAPVVVLCLDCTCNTLHAQCVPRACYTVLSLCAVLSSCTVLALCLDSTPFLHYACNSLLVLCAVPSCKISSFTLECHFFFVC